jgi:hypothetical protein
LIDFLDVKTRPENKRKSALSKLHLFGQSIEMI